MSEFLPGWNWHDAAVTALHFFTLLGMYLFGYWRGTRENCAVRNNTNEQ